MMGKNSKMLYTNISFEFEMYISDVEYIEV